MNDLQLTSLIEATLLAAGRPVTTQQLVDLFDERERPSLDQVREALVQLAAEYENRGIELQEVASGWRVQVRTKYVDLVSRLWQERPSRYSRALLETLALIAYRQPITRGEIEEIRGVTVSSTIMRTLQERNWIRVVGHREVPGHPELLGTTREFLDYFGLKGLDQLPSLAELKDLETIGVQLELSSGDLAPEAAADDPDETDGEVEQSDASTAVEDEESAPERQASPMVADASEGQSEQPTLEAPANDSRGDSWE